VAASRVGETFHLDLDGTAFAGRYIEVEPPHRMLLRWDRQGTDTANVDTDTGILRNHAPPTGDGTNVGVQFSGLVRRMPLSIRNSGRVTLTELQLSSLASNPRTVTESGTACSDSDPQVHHWCRGLLHESVTGSVRQLGCSVWS
jgi:uncharacterized protein YndB with AHSA1/START domain